MYINLDLHNEFPLCPENYHVTADELSPFQQEQAKNLGINPDSYKLCATLHDKKNYVTHFW